MTAKDSSSVVLTGIPGSVSTRLAFGVTDMNASQAVPGHTVLLRLPEVRARTGLSKPTIYRKISSGEFPKPHKIGRVAVWPARTIETWIQTSVLREGS